MRIRLRMNIGIRKSSEKENIEEVTERTLFD